MNTPETDARVWSDHSEGILHEVVEASFARKLERERDEAKEKLNTNLTEISNKLVVAMRERDEAREEWGKASMDAAQLLSEKTKAIAERDELRELHKKSLCERDEAVGKERELKSLISLYINEKNTLNKKCENLFAALKY